VDGSLLANPDGLVTVHDEDEDNEVRRGRR